MFCSSYYPTHCRATGVAWAGSAGRLGSFVGSGAVGWLMVSGLTGEQIINMMLLPACLASVSMVMITQLIRKRERNKNVALGRAQA